MSELHQTAHTWHLGSEGSKAIWQTRWDKKTEILPNVDWDNFRNNADLMEGLDTRVDYFPNYLAANALESVPLELCEDSGIGNPEGNYINGRFYTADSLRFGRYIHSLQKVIAYNRLIRVAEIGCGYGGFALNFVEHCKVASYTLIDVEPCRTIQKKYHSLASEFPFNYATVSAERQDDIGEIDLFISTNSLGEMEEQDIDRFFTLIHSKLKPRGLFYSNNMEGEGFVYPFDTKWHQLSLIKWGPSVWERIAIRL